MANKFTEQDTQKLKICRNKRKIDGFRIEADSPIRTRQNLNKKLNQKVRTQPYKGFKKDTKLGTINTTWHKKNTTPN